MWHNGYYVRIQHNVQAIHFFNIHMYNVYFYIFICFRRCMCPVLVARNVFPIHKTRVTDIAYRSFYTPTTRGLTVMCLRRVNIYFGEKLPYFSETVLSLLFGLSGRGDDVAQFDKTYPCDASHAAPKDEQYVDYSASLQVSSWQLICFLIRLNSFWLSH